MKRISLYMAIAVLGAVTACDDGALFNESPTPAVAAPESSPVVTRDEIIKALDVDEEATDAAMCITQSSLVFGGTNSLTIIRTGNTTMGRTPAAIITSINITIHDTGRGRSCAEGALGYIITASEEVPIAIEVDTGLNSRHSLTPFARTTPSAYPDQCEIRAHFETVSICVDEDGNEIQPPRGRECETEQAVDIKLIVDDYYCQPNRRTT